MRLYRPIKEAAGIITGRLGHAIIRIGHMSYLTIFNCQFGKAKSVDGWQASVCDAILQPAIAGWYLV